MPASSQIAIKSRFETGQKATLGGYPDTIMTVTGVSDSKVSVEWPNALGITQRHTLNEWVLDPV